MWLSVQTPLMYATFSWIIANWKKTSMKNARGNPVKHDDLICAIDKLITESGLAVKGHCGATQLMKALTRMETTKQIR